MTHIVAIVPARGGSKGLKNKNVRILQGKPLIVHTIEDAQEAIQINQVYVSTEDLEIARISRSSGAKIINRPAELANDTATSASVLIHALTEMEAQKIYPDLIVCLQCTSPIRTGKDIDLAIKQIQAAEADSLLSVSPSNKFLWTQVNGIAKPVNYDYNHRPRRQDINQEFMENGSIYIFKPSILKNSGTFLGGKISLFVMDKYNVDIDDSTDFAIAELYLGNLAKIQQL